LAQGLERGTNPSLPNRVSEHADVNEAKEEREMIVTHFMDAIRTQLPALIEALSKIQDFRNPKKIKHQLAMVLFYGMLCFVLHTSSRREANRDMTGPVLKEHLQQLFPEIETLPHQDTLNRILSRIDVEKIQDAHVQMIGRLIRNKKFIRWLIDGCYPIAIDGTQKLVRRDQVSEQWLQRRKNREKENESIQYYVYVLEATLSFQNGLTLPLMSEFLNYAEGDISNDKQDCELKAFTRLAKRLKTAFPRLPIMILLDGLYPNGPVLQMCRQYHWQFMIVLKDGNLKSVWEDFNGLKVFLPNQQSNGAWGNRRQNFTWVNDIEYFYGKNQKKKQIVHVVLCEESWMELDSENNQIKHHARHAWISSKHLTKKNLHERCNLGARFRWGIEEAILVEKHHGYAYEHLFSHNWNAMKGYHYLMHTAHALNTLARFSEHLFEFVLSKGVRPFIKYIRDSLVHPWLDPESLKQKLHPKPQLRLT